MTCQDVKTARITLVIAAITAWREDVNNIAMLTIAMITEVIIEVVVMLITILITIVLKMTCQAIKIARIFFSDVIQINECFGKITLFLTNFQLVKWKVANNNEMR